MKQAVPWWFFFPDVTFHYLMWLLRIAAVPWGWCDFSRLMWLKYGASIYHISIKAVYTMTSTWPHFGAASEAPALGAPRRSGGGVASASAVRRSSIAVTRVLCLGLKHCGLYGVCVGFMGFIWVYNYIGNSGTLDWYGIDVRFIWDLYGIEWDFYMRFYWNMNQSTSISPIPGGLRSNSIFFATWPERWSRPGLCSQK